MCLYPRMIKNRKFTSNKKNGGNIPPIHDIRTMYVPVGCGKCIECRKQKARGWQVRLLEDIREHKNGKFITLTFSNQAIKELNEHEKIKDLKGYEKDNGIAILATRLWLERWRKKFKKSLRHWLVTELGHNGTENIHMHGIIWTNEPLEKVEKTWQYGYVWKGKLKNGKYENYVNEKTVNYIIKYIHKRDEKHKNFESKVLTSPGIGANYTKRLDSKQNKYNGTETNELYRTRTGHKIAMPTYWRNKIYTDEEREKLWINKLNKDERWICGERVENSNTKEYYKLLLWHRERSKKLGYGTNEKNWTEEEYEKSRRELMIKKRIENS